ncbi:MAG: FAD-dependent oxidoreductase [Ilumatobacteraceae bacterium]
MTREAPHVVVVGGGITGLTAAFRLVGSGLRVSLLEAPSTVGGKVRTGSFAGLDHVGAGHGLEVRGAGLGGKCPRSEKKGCRREHEAGHHSHPAAEEHPGRRPGLTGPGRSRGGVGPAGVSRDVKRVNGGGHGGVHEGVLLGFPCGVWVSGCPGPGGPRAVDNRSERVFVSFPNRCSVSRTNYEHVFWRTGVCLWGRTSVRWPPWLNRSPLASARSSTSSRSPCRSGATPRRSGKSARPWG